MSTVARPWWRRALAVIGWTALVLLLLALLAAVRLAGWVGDHAGESFSLIVAGRDVAVHVDPRLGDTGAQVAFFLLAFCGLFALTVLLPLALLLALAVALFGVVLGATMSVVVPIGAVVLAFSPIWLPLWLWWRHRRRSQAAAAPTTIAR